MINERKSALVFAGGGTKGGYEMGFWKATNELSISFDIITGCSIGALNGALMAQGDFDIALNFWENLDIDLAIKEIGENYLNRLKNKKKRDTAELALSILKNHHADILPMENTLRNMVNEEKIRNSKTDFGLVTVEMENMTPHEKTISQIPKGQLVDYLMASSACYPAFPPHEIDGKMFIDGGYYDNLPISLAVKMGATEVTALDLSAPGIKRKAKAPGVKISHIESKWDLGSFLDFDKENSKRRIALGYNDAMKFYGKLDGNLFTFQKGESEKNFDRYCQSYNKISKQFDLPSLKLDIQKNYEGKDVLLTLSERCGECFSLEPTKIYDFKEFNKELSFLILDMQRDKSPFREILRSISSPASYAKELKKLSHQQIVFGFYEEFMEFLEKGEEVWLLSYLAPLFPKEVSAAIYLAIITE